MPTLIALIVCLIPTTIGALLAAIGIAGMDRALRANIIAKSGKAVEVAGDVDTVMLDKTGTITIGDRQAREFIPLGVASQGELVRLAALASVSDQTPEGRSIVAAHAALEKLRAPIAAPDGAEFVAFTAQSRMSGVNLPGGVEIRKGAPDAIIDYVERIKGVIPPQFESVVAKVGARGATPLAVAANGTIAGVIALEDILKPGIRERMEQLRLMGLRTVMITGDNSLTAQAIAHQAGVDDFIAEATPEKKLNYLRAEQNQGKLVAMMGDGTNDAPSLAQADVGLAMNSGTQAAKEAGNMVDLDSDPTKLIEVVAIGKQLLMTRGALTTFSIANDVAKYFAIVPAMFAGTLPWLKAIDVMHLHSPTSAILSAVIFNALIIPLLIPIALKGVRYQPLGADALLRRNLLIWGLGGVIVPFIGIKAIDVVMVALNLGRLKRRVAMLRYFAKSALLIGISVVVVCGVYPGVLWVIGQTLFPFAANGSIVHDDSGKVIGSLLVAQPFTKDEYFQPRPSAASFDATASTSSGYAPSNYALRDRVARALGPIVTYADGDKKGQLVAPDVEAWFKADKAGGNPHIVAQWADAHNSIAQAWVTGDPTHAAYVDAWAKAHDDVVKDWIKKNPATPQPKARTSRWCSSSPSRTIIPACSPLR